MKKTIMSLIILVAVLVTSLPVNAATEVRTNPLTGEKKIVVVADKPAAYLEGFDFNGKYYPAQYFVSTTVESSRAAMLKIDKTQKAEYKWENEFLYNQVTKAILDKYPIIINGTVEQKTARQVEQLCELVRWFHNNTEYADGEKSTTTSVSMTIFNYGRYLTDKVGQATLKTTGYKFNGVCEFYAYLFQQASFQMGIDSGIVDIPHKNHVMNNVVLSNGDVLYFDMTGADFMLQYFFCSYGKERDPSMPAVDRVVDMPIVSGVRVQSLLNDFTYPCGPYDTAKYYDVAIKVYNELYEY